MAEVMRLERKVNISVLKFLKNLYADTAFINVVDGFPETEFSLPTIALEYDDITLEPSELGNRIHERVFYWFVDIFASNKAQRDEFGFKLIEALETDKIPVYDFAEVVPPSSDPTIINYLDIENIELHPVKVFPELTEKMYYRAYVKFVGKLIKATE